MGLSLVKFYSGNQNLIIDYLIMYNETKDFMKITKVKL